MPPRTAHRARAVKSTRPTSLAATIDRGTADRPDGRPCDDRAPASARRQYPIRKTPVDEPLTVPFSSHSSEARKASCDSFPTSRCGKNRTVRRRASSSGWRRNWLIRLTCAVGFLRHCRGARSSQADHPVDPLFLWSPQLGRRASSLAELSARWAPLLWQLYPVESYAHRVTTSARRTESKSGVCTTCSCSSSHERQRADETSTDHAQLRYRRHVENHLALLAVGNLSCTAWLAHAPERTMDIFRLTVIFSDIFSVLLPEDFRRPRVSDNLKPTLRSPSDRFQLNIAVPQQNANVWVPNGSQE